MNNMIDTKTTRNFSYGLFVLTAKTTKHNGCIINTAIQVTSEPYKVSIAINKNNYTTGMILESKKFNISMLSQNAKFDLFKHFGFQSGKDVDKFLNFKCYESTNGLKYLGDDIANAFISCEVETHIDLGTHYLITGKVSEAQVLSSVPSLTYDYYFKHVKPAPTTKKQENIGNVNACQLCGYEYDDAKEKVPFNELSKDWNCPLCGASKDDFRPNKVKKVEENKAKVYVCSICGYEYDEAKEKVPFDELPNDWTCPLCKHPKSDFELKE